MEGWKCEAFAHGHWMPCKIVEDFGETLSIELKESALAQSFYAVGATFIVPKERFRFQKDRYGHLALESLCKLFPPQVCKQIVSFVGESENVNLHDVAVRCANKLFGCTEFYMRMLRGCDLRISFYQLEDLPRIFPNLVYFLPEFEQCKIKSQGVNAYIPLTSDIGYTGTAIVVASNFDIGCVKLRWEMVGTEQKLEFLQFQPHFVNGVLINFYDDSVNPDETIFRIAVNPSSNALHLCMDREPAVHGSNNRVRTVVSGNVFKELLHSGTFMLTAKYLAHTWKCFLALEQEACESRFLNLRRRLEEWELPLTLASQLPPYALRELEKAVSSCEEPIVSTWSTLLSSFFATSFSNRLSPSFLRSKDTLRDPTKEETLFQEHVYLG